jgi:hypothetical protein
MAKTPQTNIGGIRRGPGALLVKNLNAVRIGNPDGAVMVPHFNGACCVI